LIDGLIGGKIWSKDRYALPHFTPIGAVVRPCGAKKQKVILIPAIFCW